MKAKCIKLVSSNRNFNDFADYLTPGRTYVILGISQVSPQKLLYEIENETGQYLTCPADLFEITDARVSSYWHFKSDDDGTFRLWPEPFFSDFFHDKLTDGAPEVERVYREIRDLILAEAR